MSSPVTLARAEKSFPASYALWNPNDVYETVLSIGRSVEGLWFLPSWHDRAAFLNKHLDSSSAQPRVTQTPFVDPVPLPYRSSKSSRIDFVTLLMIHLQGCVLPGPDS